MKTKLTVAAAGLLLALGPALAGGGLSSQTSVAFASSELRSQEVTPEMIANWKATAATSDYSSPMVPL